jgi:hypothetical protein
MHEHEARGVGNGTDETAVRRAVHEEWLERDPAIGARADDAARQDELEQRAEPARQALMADRERRVADRERGVAHVEGNEDLVAHIVGEGSIGRGLDDCAEQEEPEVGIRAAAAGFEAEPTHTREPLVQKRVGVRSRIGRRPNPTDRRRVRDTRAVLQQVPNAHRRRRRGQNAGHDRVDVVVEREALLVDETHYGRRGDDLRHREPQERMLGRERCTSTRVRAPARARRLHRTLRDDGGAQAGHVAVRDRRRERAIDRLHLATIARWTDSEEK